MVTVWPQALSINQPVNQSFNQSQHCAGCVSKEISYLVLTGASPDGNRGKGAAPLCAGGPSSHFPPDQAFKPSAHLDENGLGLGAVLQRFLPAFCPLRGRYLKVHETVQHTRQ